MFPTFGLSEKEIKSFYNTHEELNKIFELEIDDTLPLDLASFEMSKSYKSVDLREFIWLKEGKGKAFVTYTKVEYQTGPSRHSAGIHAEYQLWAGAFLKNDYGHIIIKPETLEDKLEELFSPVELDFKEDKRFSSKYYVLATDVNRAKMLINSSFRKKLLDGGFKDFYLEVKKDVLLLSNKKKLGNETVPLAGFVFAVSEEA